MATLSDKSLVLETWNREDHGGVKLLDFGDSVTVMPMTDGHGCYLTSSFCCLYLTGEGQLPPSKQMWNRDMPEEVVDLGNGWKFLGIEIGYQWPPEQLLRALEDGTKKLLEAR